MLFSGAMVVALLDGSKRVTRRIIHPQPPREATSAGTYCASGQDYDGMWEWLSGDPIDPDTWEMVGERFRSPYEHGDRVWVKEGWRVTMFAHDGGVCAIKFRADADKDNRYNRVAPERFRPNFDKYASRWQSSRFMPRFVARVTFIIGSIGVEPLQDIDERGAQIEGFGSRDSYASYWDKLHNNDGNRWRDNPWVYVYGAKEVSCS